MRKLLLWGGVVASVLASMCVSTFGVAALVELDLGLALKAYAAGAVLVLIVAAALLFTPQPARRSFVFLVPVALLTLLLMSGSAFAQTAATASTSIDFSSLAGSFENIVFSVAAAFLVWFFNRVVSAFESWTGTQLTALHGSLLTDAITEALGLARNKLDAALQGKETVDVHNQLAATAAQLVLTKVPATLAVLGITEASLVDKIKGLLGLDLSPIQTVTTAAPAPAPAFDLDTIVNAVKAAVATAAAPAPAPLSGGVGGAA